MEFNSFSIKIIKDVFKHLDGFYNTVKEPLLDAIWRLCNSQRFAFAIMTDFGNLVLSHYRVTKAIFKYVDNYLELNYKGYNICLMHYPLLSFNGMHNEKSVHFFGHIHTAKYTLPRHSYHIGVDTNNYKPIHIDKAIAPTTINPPSVHCNHSGICPLGSAYIIGLLNNKQINSNHE